MACWYDQLKKVKCYPPLFVGRKKIDPKDRVHTVRNWLFNWQLWHFLNRISRKDNCIMFLNAILYIVFFLFICLGWTHHSLNKSNSKRNKHSLSNGELVWHVSQSSAGEDFIVMNYAYFWVFFPLKLQKLRISHNGKEQFKV